MTKVLESDSQRRAQRCHALIELTAIDTQNILKPLQNSNSHLPALAAQNLMHVQGENFSESLFTNKETQFNDNALVGNGNGTSKLDVNHSPSAVAKFDDQLEDSLDEEMARLHSDDFIHSESDNYKMKEISQKQCEINDSSPLLYNLEEEFAKMDQNVIRKSITSEEMFNSESEDIVETTPQKACTKSIRFVSQICCLFQTKFLLNIN